MMKLFSIAILSILFLSQCNTPQQSAQSLSSTEPILADLNGAKEMMIAQCYACHGPATGAQRIAPPMTKVKEHYMTKDISQQEFVNAMVSFVKQPSLEASKMPGAVRKFNLMPNMGYDQASLAAIAAYIYQTPDTSGVWLQLQTTQNVQCENPAEMGRKIALSVKTALGKNLMQAIKTKGTAAAVTFCNTKALPITDSMATINLAKIARVSNQPRNLANQASEEEEEIIENYKRQLADGQEMQPVVKRTNGRINFYMPIVTNQLCMQCHGKLNEQIEPATLDVLAKVYPEDKATGYSENQVRGIWSIQWEDEQH